MPDGHVNIELSTVEDFEDFAEFSIEEGNRREDAGDANAALRCYGQAYFSARTLVSKRGDADDYHLLGYACFHFALLSQELAVYDTAAYYFEQAEDAFHRYLSTTMDIDTLQLVFQAQSRAGACHAKAGDKKASQAAYSRALHAATALAQMFPEEYTSELLSMQAMVKP